MSAKILYLDGMRGFAAFMVFLAHFIFGVYAVAYPGWGVLISWASFSVCIFFVLSGYVLTHAFFERGNQGILISGAVRRYFRLLIPILFLCIVIYLVFYPGLGRIEDLSRMLNTYSLIFWGIFFQGNTYSAYTAVLWTITIEFIGSFIVFSFASLFGNLRNRWFFYCGAFILFFNSFYVAFILGMALADINQCRFSDNFKISDLFAIILVIFAIALGSFPDGDVSSSLILGIPLVLTTCASGLLALENSLIIYGGDISTVFLLRIIGAFVLLFTLVNSTGLQKILSLKIPVFLGKISYSLYLIHALIIFTFSTFLSDVIFGQKADIFSSMANLILTSIVVIICSYLMYRYVDKPGVEFSKEIYELYFKKTT